MEIVLNTFGVSLNRDNEAFIITSKDGRQRIPVDDIKSIQISRGAQITSDAVMLAVEHEIDVMFMDRKGRWSLSDDEYSYNRLMTILTRRFQKEESSDRDSLT